MTDTNQPPEPTDTTASSGSTVGGSIDISGEERAFSVDEIIAASAAEDASTLEETMFRGIPDEPSRTDREYIADTWETVAAALDFTTSRIAELVRQREESNEVIKDLRVARSNLERFAVIIARTEASD